MSSFARTMLTATALLLLGCGSATHGNPGIPSDSLSSEMTRVESQIRQCDTPLGSFYSRPGCDMGDAWTLNAATRVDLLLLGSLLEKGI